MSSKVNVFGTPSSGSTFVWQVLKSLGCNPGKSHGYNDCDNDIKFVTYRDPRDLLCSMAFREMQRFKAAGCQRNITYQGMVIRCMSMCSSWFRQTIEAFDASKINNSIIMIRYEDFFPNNTADLVRLIAKKLGKNLTKSQCEQLAEKHSLERNKALSKHLKSFPDVDKRNKIRGNHITANGRVGVWKEKLEADTVKEIEKNLQQYIDKFEYHVNE